jgi:hypothetical protein
VCPDGVKYDWNKASRIGRVKKERVSWNARLKLEPQKAVRIVSYL